MASLIQLVAGQRIPIQQLTQGEDLRISLTIDGIDETSCLSAILCLDGQQQVIDGREVVSRNHARSRCGGVERTNATQFRIDFSRLATQIERVVLVVGLLDKDGTGAVDSDAITHGEVGFSVDGQAAARFSFTGRDFTREKALCLAELYRKGDWRLAIIPGGYRGGLAVLLSNYKVSPELINSLCRPDALAPLAAAEGRPRLPTEAPGRRMPSAPGDLMGAVGLIVAEDAAGQSYTGTGFVVAPGGLILTCAHVMEGFARGGIALAGSTELRDVDILAVDAEHDTALLYLKDRAGSSDWLLLTNPESEPVLGDPLGILGYPLGTQLGLDVSYCEGIVNSRRTMRGVNVLQIDAGAAPGSSGAPVFCRRTFRVVGILTSGLNQAAGMHVNFAVDIRQIWKLDWFDQVPVPA